MFCEKCGNKLLDSAKFCTSCGTSVSTTKRNVEKVLDTDMVLKVKPSINVGYMVLPTLIPYTIFMVITGIVFAIITPIAGIAILLVGFAILAVILGIKIAFNKKRYANFSYEFYKTKVVYRDSFLSLNEKEVKYKNIREITMRQTFMQRYFNIGNIILFTNAETGYANGICMVNLENVQEIYKNIKSIIDV